jgi:hypothetical protein
LRRCAGSRTRTRRRSRTTGGSKNVGAVTIAAAVVVVNVVVESVRVCTRAIIVDKGRRAARRRDGGEILTGCARLP